MACRQKFEAWAEGSCGDLNTLIKGFFGKRWYQAAWQGWSGAWESNAEELTQLRAQVAELQAQVARYEDVAEHKHDALQVAVNLISWSFAQLPKLTDAELEPLDAIRQALALTASTYQSEGHFSQTEETLKQNGETLAEALTVKEQS